MPLQYLPEGAVLWTAMVFMDSWMQDFKRNPGRVGISASCWRDPGFRHRSAKLSYDFRHFLQSLLRVLGWYLKISHDCSSLHPF